MIGLLLIMDYFSFGLSLAITVLLIIGALVLNRVAAKLTVRTRSELGADMLSLSIGFFAFGNAAIFLAEFISQAAISLLIVINSVSYAARLVGAALFLIAFIRMRKIVFQFK